MNIPSSVKFSLLCGLAILVCCLLISRQSSPKAIEPAQKINGISLVAPSRAIEKDALMPVKEENANWIVITPYAFSETGRASVTFNHNRQWWGERKKGVAQTIIYAKELGLKVMLKPHVWVHGQGWTGDFSLQSEAQWKQWEHDYGAYITAFAHLADSLNVEMVCIGTEYSKAANERPQFWRQLIKNIRSFYSGKLTYASNWDNYMNISFWDALDYVGIDAYFPLSDQRMPTVAQLKGKWNPIKRNLNLFSHQTHKSILFTEFGYESVDYATAGHWKFERGDRASNMQAQSNAYQALFETFWDEPWFAGGYLWKWSVQSSHYHRNQSKSYTPKNKPAEKTIQAWYKNH